MILASRAMPSSAAFSTVHTLIIRCPPPLRSSRCHPGRLISRNSYSIFSAFSNSTVRSRSISVPLLARAAQTYTSRSFSSPVLFDKAPDKLPDWWNDDDDDEEEEQNISAGTVITNDSEHDSLESGRGGAGKRGGSGGGSGGRGGGGSGNWDDGTEKNFFVALLALYSRAVQSAPIRTKAVSTCVLALLGDGLAQKLSQRDRTFRWDARRSGSIGLWGFCFMGPVLHYWYGTLDRLFFGRFAIWQKLLLDQTLFATFFNGAFIAGVGSMEGSPPAEVAETLKSKLWPSMKANWTLWPAAQFVNFAFVPKTFQIVYVNFVALFWNVVLTYISHDHDDKPDRKG